MDDITKVIQKRFVEKGSEIRMLPSYIRDLTNILAVRYDLNLQEINIKLRLLGWNDFELDYHTLQLIIAFIESNDSHTRDGGWTTALKTPDKIEKHLIN